MLYKCHSLTGWFCTLISVQAALSLHFKHQSRLLSQTLFLYLYVAIWCNANVKCHMSLGWRKNKYEGWTKHFKVLPLQKLKNIRHLSGALGCRVPDCFATPVELWHTLPVTQTLVRRAGLFLRKPEARVKRSFAHRLRHWHGEVENKLRCIETVCVCECVC